MKTRDSVGFTLVELLVVIAIIGILVGMLLPGIQAAREAGRRATCINHLTQLGVALQSYEAAQGSLPPGVVNPEGPIVNEPKGKHVGWLVQLLPYLEEEATFKHIDASVGVYDKKNEPVRKLRIALFVCPSAPYGPADGPGTSSYAGCHHDVEAAIDEDNHGVLYLNSSIRSTDIPDGATHTIVVGEKRRDQSDLGWMSGTRATLRNTGTPLNGTTASPASEEVAPADAVVDRPKLAVGGFGSLHAGVTNFLFGDGAIHSMSDATSPDLLQQLGHRADGKLLTGGPTRIE